MEKIIVDNLSTIKINPDDSYIYLAPDAIYQQTLQSDHNVFYEKLMMISFFLRGFAGYDDTLILAFTKSLGMISFVFLVEKTLKDNDTYKFFTESYEGFKRDKHFREQTNQILELFEEIAKQFENIDLAEVQNILKDTKELKE